MTWHDRRRKILPCHAINWSRDPHDDSRRRFRTLDHRVQIEAEQDCNAFLAYMPFADWHIYGPLQFLQLSFLSVYIRFFLTPYSTPVSAVKHLSRQYLSSKEVQWSLQKGKGVSDRPAPFLDHSRGCMACSEIMCPEVEGAAQGNSNIFLVHTAFQCSYSCFPILRKSLWLGQYMLDISCSA